MHPTYPKDQCAGLRLNANWKVKPAGCVGKNIPVIYLLYNHLSPAKHWERDSHFAGPDKA